MSYASSRFVWYNRHGKGRNRFACFRKRFELRKAPQSATLHLFADTAYQLFVNGSLVQFGPVRFDRQHPQYDSVNIGPYLAEGTNAVAALVKSYGCKTFKDNSESGAFLAWGQISDGDGGKVDFRTGAGADWRAKRCEAFDEHAVKASFALDAIDLFDQSKWESDWTAVDFDDSAWPAAVELDDQRDWVELSPRSIPFMSLEPVEFEAPKPVSALQDLETIFSFSAPAAEMHDADDIFVKKDQLAIAVATGIHSPRRQEVTLGLFWGRYYLNGRACEAGERSDRLRQDYLVLLEEGWNDFFAIEPAFDDCIAFMLAAPRAAELSLSPRRRLEDELVFARTRVTDPKLLEQRLGGAMPRAFDASFDSCGGWVAASRSDREGNPGRRSLWDEYSPTSEFVSAADLREGKRFPLARYPSGFSILLSFEYTTLVLPSLEIQGAAGAEVDLSYSERFAGDGQHLAHDIVYCAGDRILPSGDETRYLSSQPRGARYCRLTVRKASDDVVIKNLSFRSCHYPVSQLGGFRCSDPVLNAVWEMCERTQRANMEDAFVDCPGRERGMYIRDTLIQFHNALAAYGDTQLMGRCMELVGQSPGEAGKFRCVFPNAGSYTIADFSLEAIEAYWQYYLRSGDVERLEMDWPAMRGSVEWFNQLADERDDGLLDADWPSKRGVVATYGGLHGDNSVSKELLDKSGPNANLTFPYLAMLRDAASIARAIGNEREAIELEARRERIAASARRLFWNEDRQRFNDNLLGATQSYHANLLAITSGVADEKQRRAVRDWIEASLNEVFINGKSPSDGVNFSPAYSFFIFRGLYELKLPHVAELLIRKGWGWMVDRGCVTTPEFFSSSYSQCHAWSASPMYYLSRYGLGVSFPDAPDNSVVELDIRSELEWAEGSFPIPGRGEAIDVRWRRSPEGAMEVTVRAPADVTVRWDASKLSVLRADGREPDALAC